MSKVQVHRSFSRKKIWGTEISFFCHFLKFASLVFLDIAQDCSLGQCLTSSRAEQGSNRPKSGSK